jgi:hypothetical protein
VRLEDIEEGKRLLAEHERAYDSIADHSEGSKAREEAVLLAHDLCIDLQGWIFDNAPDLLAAAERDWVAQQPVVMGEQGALSVERAEGEEDDN